MAHARANVQARAEARDAVKAAGSDTTRDEIRLLLEQELGKRGAEEDPLTIEREVEMILAEREPFGKARFAFRILKQLKDSQSPPRTRPSTLPGQPLSKPSGGPILGVYESTDDESDWLKPPERAAYPVMTPGPKWTPADLDAEARPWLERIGRSDPNRLAPYRDLEVWLTRDDRGSGAESRLAVHIGTERVGAIRAGREEPFWPVMEAAAERDEDPWMRGRLSTTTDQMPYLLEVETPAPVPDHDPTSTPTGDR